MRIIVRHNDVDQALRTLKRKLQLAGVFRKMKFRRRYGKPTKKRARENATAVSLAREADCKRTERDR